MFVVMLVSTLTLPSGSDYIRQEKMSDVTACFAEAARRYAHLKEVAETGTKWGFGCTYGPEPTEGDPA